MQSVLDIFDLERGTAQTVLRTDQHIEAPNWSRDGAFLIVNGGGRLYRVPLNDPQLIAIDCGGLQHLNNDHGISPDGRSIVVSNSPGRGTSVIYRLGIDGGDATRVTDRAPSWWHGWSPDGKTLAYAAVRDEQFGIVTCPLTGGDETMLITSAHHYDGPDYSPDGNWIWFNSDRGGSMQLWRMRVDGTGVEQMTNDERVNWFAHPSPDGRHVVYLAYEAGTEGHPAERTVQLRLIDLTTGATQVLTEIFGGQGTINVPSWSPDGKRFAYMRYA